MDELRMIVLIERLRNFTIECREDMHEPDEQGIHAEYGPAVRVVNGGTKHVFYEHPTLDNACTNEEGDMGFWLVKPDKREWFNLADIIALARMAKLD